MSKITRRENRRNTNDIARANQYKKYESIFDTELLKNRRTANPVINPMTDKRVFNPVVKNPRTEKITGFSKNQVRQRLEKRLKVRGERDILSIRDWAFHPKENMICLRRKIRREIMFAKGRSGSGNKRPKYSEDSLVKCRR
jgi:hypothetical protein